VVFHEKKSLTIEEITAFCQKNLAKFKIPKYFDFIPELPVNNAGKIDRKKLRHS
jgi:acyl-CoA synthetase (AMP-forming)/AMP-acid ligase II